MAAMAAVPSGAAPGVYKARRPQASPLFRLVSDHFRAFHHAHDERFAPANGDWRPMVREVADKFLACGVLDHGFARVRCDACTHEYLLAFSCKARYFCPSCHAKRLALWTLWLEDSLLVAGVPHRQVVLTIPKASARGVSTAARSSAISPDARRLPPNGADAASVRMWLCHDALSGVLRLE